MTYYMMHFYDMQMDYLLDLHTASFGRVNSLYVRADMNDPVTARLAKLQNPQVRVTTICMRRVTYKVTFSELARRCNQASTRLAVVFPQRTQQSHLACCHLDDVREYSTRRSTPLPHPITLFC